MSDYSTVRWAFLGAALGAAMMAGFMWSYRLGRGPVSAPVASAAPIPSVAPAPSTSSDPELDKWDSEHQRAMQRKFGMIDRCEKQGGAAAMGFGASVVCVKALWVEDPKFPAWSK